MRKASPKKKRGSVTAARSLAAFDLKPQLQKPPRVARPAEGAASRDACASPDQHFTRAAWLSRGHSPRNPERAQESLRGAAGRAARGTGTLC